MSVLLLSDLFVQLDFNSFIVCYVKIFEQIKADGWIMSAAFLLRPCTCQMTKHSYDEKSKSNSSAETYKHKQTQAAMYKRHMNMIDHSLTLMHIGMFEWWLLVGAFGRPRYG